MYKNVRASPSPSVPTYVRKEVGVCRPYLCIRLHIFTYVYVYVNSHIYSGGSKDSAPSRSLVSKTQRMPYRYISFSAKEPYNSWLFGGKWHATSGTLWVFATLCVLYNLHSRAHPLFHLLHTLTKKHTYIHVCACLFKYAYTVTFTCHVWWLNAYMICLRVHKCMFTHMYACSYIFVHVYSYTYLCTHVYIHVQMYTCTEIHMCVYLHVCRL